MLAFLILFVIWAIAHSISASRRFKAWARRKMGVRFYDGTYRLLYNLLATITLAPVLAAGVMVVPQRVLWSIPQPLNLVFAVVQIAALIGLLVSLLQTDPMRFAGLGQFARYLRGQEDINPNPVLITSGAYRFVRHPLYTFSLLLLWFAPVMTLSLLLFNIAATIYFWVGSGYEERRLAAAFGDEYEAYRRDTPRLLPVKLNS
jgi:protein-S-isoprenylcysteine O-methyltransferase Ste14